MSKVLALIYVNSYRLCLTVCAVAVLTLVTGGCIDNEIEGASATGAAAFGATKATSSFSALNTCGGASVGTTFNVKIDLTGQETVGFASGRYKFSTQSNYTELSSYNYVQTGGSSNAVTGFRAPTKTTSAPNFITVTHCVRFGTSTSIEYVYDLVSSNGNESTISLIINRPASAN